MDRVPGRHHLTGEGRAAQDAGAGGQGRRAGRAHLRSAQRRAFGVREHAEAEGDGASARGAGSVTAEGGQGPAQGRRQDRRGRRAYPAAQPRLPLLRLAVQGWPLQLFRASGELQAGASLRGQVRDSDRGERFIARAGRYHLQGAERG